MEEIKEKLKNFLKKTKFNVLKSLIIINLIESSLENFEKFEKAEVQIGFYHLEKKDSLRIVISCHFPFEKIKEEWEKKGKTIKFSYFYKFADKIVLRENGKTSLELYFYL